MANVQEIIGAVERGEYVIPDFQRNFVWQPEEISELIASILGDYPIGTLLILESSSKDPLFKLAPVAGVKQIADSSTLKVILDGQQRITSLFYALTAPDLPVPDRKSPARFFLDIDKLCKGEVLSSVKYCLTSRKKTLRELQDPQKYIPLTVFKDQKLLMEYMKKYDVVDKMPEIMTANISFLKYNINEITLRHAGDLERIVETFERLNRNGRPLSTFDLVSAHLYKHGPKLKNYVSESSRNPKYMAWWPKDEKEVALMVLKIMLLVKEKTLDRNRLLKMNHADFDFNWKKALEALNSAHLRLKNRYGVYDEKRILPMPPMLIPLSAMIAAAKTDSDYKKIDRWYWNAVFCQRYDGAANTRAVSDVLDVTNWMKTNDDKADAPDFFDAYDFENIDFENVKESSALYRGIMCAYATQGCRDFKTGESPALAPDKIQDDHIFPSSKYKDDNILNRTLIASNQSKNDRDPDDYFKEMNNTHGHDELVGILKTHLISRSALNALLLNDKKGFKEERKKSLIELHKKLVG